MLKKIKLTLGLLIITCYLANAQGYVEIGSGTVSSGYPVNSAWNYGWFSAIYPQAALPSGSGAKTITSIAFYCNNGPKTENNQKIYMKNSSDNVFGSANYENPTGNGYTLVYDGNITYNGWTTITLSTPFLYDGIANLIIHYESRDGSYDYVNFNSTTSAINNNKSGGSDVSFPTNTGYLNPFPSSLPNIRIYYASSNPATPDNPNPTINASKVAIDKTLTFDLGANTTLYDLYLGTDSANVTNLNASVKVVADAVVAAPANYSYGGHALFNASTKYFWKVVAKNATTTTSSPLWKFTTQRVIETFPFTYGFEDSTVFYPGWYGSFTDWTYANSPINWNQGGELNAKVGLGCAYNNCNVNGSYSLMTPRINLPTDYRISFWWANKAPNFKVGTYDSTFFEITNDGGINWFTLDTLSPSAAMIGYEQSVVDLGAYAGNNVYLRWRQEVIDWTSAKASFLDDILIEPIPSDAQIMLDAENISFLEMCVGGYTSKKVAITNNGTQNLIISNTSTNNISYNCAYTGTIPPGNSDTATIVFSPTASGVQNAILTFNISGSYTGTNTITLTGDGLSPLNNIAEAFDVSTELPIHWNKIKSAYDLFTDVTVVNSPSDAHSGTNCAKMLELNDTISPLILITPGVTGFADHQFSFWAFKYGNYDLDLIVGLMDNPYDTAFTAVQSFALTENYVKYTVTFDAANTKPYIAIKHGGNKKISSARIDDVLWETTGPTLPNCATLVAPSDNAVDVIQNPTLLWSSGGGSPTGYKIYYGTTNPPSNLLADITTTSYTFTSNLALSTNYFWQVIPYNASGDAVGCPVWNFTTMDDQTIVSLPWLEDFNAVVQTSGSTVPLGWLNQITSTNPMPVYWDLMIPAQPINAHSPPKCMNVGPNYYAKDCWLITPGVMLTGGTDYTLNFWYKNAIGLGGEFEKMEVKWGTDQNAAGMTEGLLFDDNNISTGEYMEALVTFTPSVDDVYYFGFHAYSDESQFILFLDDVLIDYATATKDALNSKDVKIFPNPNNGKFFIDRTFTSNANIKVLDMLGKEVFSMTSYDRTVEIDLENLKTGIYQVIIEDSKSRYIRKITIL